MITGRLLREQRESLNLSQLDVANLSCLSLNQVKALEDDDATPFYSEQIKLHCLKRVALSLELDLGDATANIATSSYLFNINGPPALSMASQLHKKVFALGREARPFFINGAIVVAILWLANFALRDEASKNISSDPIRPIMNQPSMALSQASIEKPHVKSEQATAPSSAMPAAEPDAPALMAESSKTNCTDGAAFEERQVTAPIKAANKVYFSSALRQKVCLSDASGKVKWFSLNDKAGHVFQGSPPFIIAAEKPTALSLFFQGKKVKLDDLKHRAIKLNASPDF
ncbi:Cro/C1-type helix-turn-helix domain [Methylophilaceae bacterium]